MIVKVPAITPCTGYGLSYFSGGGEGECLAAQWHDGGVGSSDSAPDGSGAGVGRIFGLDAGYGDGLAGGYGFGYGDGDGSGELHAVDRGYGNGAYGEGLRKGGGYGSNYAERYGVG